jgi:hypothetical protein
MTPQDIRSILDKSGYLFEQQVASTIEKEGYETVTNKAYLDEEENKSREIDILAMKEAFRIEGTEGVIGLVYLNCECKNSSNPFVFITRKKNERDKVYKPNDVCLVHDMYTVRTREMEKASYWAFHYMALNKIHYATKSPDKAVQICKIVRNQSKLEAQHSGIIEGFIYPLIKSMRIWKKNSPVNNYSTRYFKLFANLAIVNSKLYTIDSEITDALPIEVPFVPFVREIQTQDIKGTFLITFVNYEHLETFLKNELTGFCNSVYDKYKSHPELLHGSIIFK